MWTKASCCQESHEERLLKVTLKSFWFVNVWLNFPRSEWTSSVYCKKKKGMYYINQSQSLPKCLNNKCFATECCFLGESAQLFWIAMQCTNRDRKIHPFLTSTEMYWFSFDSCACCAFVASYPSAEWLFKRSEPHLSLFHLPVDLKATY